MKKESEDKGFALFTSRFPNLKWSPKHAAFQLTENKMYGRHEKHFKEANWPRIHHEVAKAWNLKPFAQDLHYIYYK